MHRTRFFTAMVTYKIEDKKEGDGEEAYDTDATGEDRQFDDKVRKEVHNIQVDFCKPRHHYDEDESLPPIHETYTKDPVKSEE